MFLPPNCTSVYQPLDQGIISALKIKYKTEMVSKLVHTYSGNLEQLRERANQAKSGRKGLKFGCKANILDCAHLLKKSWDSLLPTAIENCWRHSKCLPIPREQPECSSQPSSQNLPDDSITEIEKVY